MDGFFRGQGAMILHREEAQPDTSKMGTVAEFSPTRLRPIVELTFQTGTLGISACNHDVARRHRERGRKKIETAGLHPGTGRWHAKPDKLRVAVWSLLPELYACNHFKMAHTLYRGSWSSLRLFLNSVF